VTTPDDQPFSLPDRIAIDGNGFGWRVWDDSEMWSMVPQNPDNSPIPLPVTWFVRVEDDPPGPEGGDTEAQNCDSDVCAICEEIYCPGCELANVEKVMVPILRTWFAYDCAPHEVGHYADNAAVDLSWALQDAGLLASLAATPEGLSEEERRLVEDGRRLHLAPPPRPLTEGEAE
jgi:hypothetical protein